MNVGNALSAYQVRRRGLIASALVAALVGCGGGDADPSAATQLGHGGGASEQVEASGDPAAATSSAESGATVVIGDETFEFDGIDAPGCVRIGGQVSGGASVADRSVRLTFGIPPEDWETNERFNDPPVISIFDARTDPEVRWASGLAGGQVDTYTIDDGGAQGSATFTSESLIFTEGFVSESVAGTFEIACGG